ncbi:flagellar hook-associated protein 3 [Oryzomonas sagensis]|uniref:Flagellar hook-associated protein 3 n=1 Tax=Oryzomonas sagensis TaxID=2603857 RepID=A0ABQ6TRL7_9BACT|nr:flagellar hook-associated protein FlgL [Oryzomonas sagensis]KAB0671670.1 flagellar hook-associated protein 3 [Oryzomonas sagensis]
MRITSNMTSDLALYNLQQGQAKLNKLQEQASSQVQINRPSDDPIGARLLTDIGDKIKAGDQYASNITKTSTWLQTTSTALDGMAGFMEQAKKLADSITAGSTDPSVGQTVISQLQSLKQQLVDMGNTQYGDQYVFGGTNNQQPFSYTSNSYQGNENTLSVEIGQGATQQMNITGNQLLTGSSTATPANPTPYGTTNILQTIDNLITDIGANNVSGIKADSKAIEAGATQITNAQTDVAARLLRLDNATTLNTNTKNTLETIAGNVQYVDLAQVGVELTQQQTSYQASLSATAKISQMSLLDYLK